MLIIIRKGESKLKFKNYISIIFQEWLIVIHAVTILFVNIFMLMLVMVISN